jgi:EAL domain-containing protein (putative c-di-GMP-specific phosphodiesterase class I)
MSVNISGRQLEDPGLLDDVRSALACGVEPTQLILEITESSLVLDTPGSRAVLEGLSDLGVQLALDDFGTGFSSLAYLKRLPLDIVKIDKSFVDALSEPGPGGVAMIRTVVGFADALHLRTVAEGTERADQLAQLTQLGCGSAQGFVLARPMAPEQARAMVNGHRLHQPA